MPEGDTLRRTADALRGRLLGKEISQARPDFLKRVEGTTVTSIEANGKHLLIGFDSGLVLHSHLRMTGSWHLYKPGEAWRKPARLATAVLAGADAVAVLFSAPTAELVRSKDAVHELAHLGPDMLAPELDLTEILRRARSSPRQALGELLLDQRVAAGIGNIHKCEALWRLRLDPWRPASDLSDAELGALFQEARTGLQAGVRGIVRPAVAGRAGRSCPRCSHRIQCVLQGAPPRFTYYCPTCQTGVLR
ncbi:MAG TPA: DNA-formamidopyrimidine glycosylase family protein [Candidatus Dormibacteraeota bacterium]|nr:DNA-formamidopyrimidine glycosylase family protein [Candidatus Dormibacteraeota bacterium]